MTAGGRGTVALGALLLVIGMFIVTGVDRRIEAFALNHQPDHATEGSTAL